MIKKIRAIQMAHQIQGQNFYVTPDGIKRDYNLLGGKYDFKIYNNRKAVIVENFEGKIVEEITLSSELRNTADAEVREDDKPKRSKKPAN
jgi:hypothetical protein